ncbi:FlgD immunoglobulin-like domain containing protein [Natronogracilivirga saccharolytica]|uniref:FlgD/Vpr Ig-like domain-containing protein n=1 Tax=Natronogracilivirga saccharolytica TaxID=2812953 RepID=A0A8J7RKD3_9BACT|nr:FlgD immunoglobulin-like domain containing protein [Natronogracilivirga saccharolytica]MBP3192420.1 hypothetical protein [Natronogracilivirga saccharolytica]
MRLLPASIFLIFFLAVCLFAAPRPSFAQIEPGQISSPYNSISQNSISNMGAYGDTVWTGPRMYYNVANDMDWLKPEGVDSVTDGRGRLFSIALAQDSVIAGIGYTDTQGGESVQAQMGFYITSDGGLSWELVDTSRTLDHPDDNTIRYGGQDLEIVPVIVPQQSPPYVVDFRGDVAFFAGWASGIRRSTDFGQTWERIVLPPFELDRLDPEETYDFVIDPRGDGQSNNYLNFLGFSVLIAEDGHVYAGTAGGINISDNALDAPADSIRWRHIRASRDPDGLLGNWVTAIRENSYDNAVWMTNWSAITGEDTEGIVATRDAGETFEQHLAGERIYDIGFRDEAIFAAGSNGLFISRDNGRNWQQTSRIRSPNTSMKPGTTYYAVANASDRIWIGSSDGLASTTDDGETWEITRVNFPLDGENQHQDDAPDVDTYAYPNPFSPRNHDLVRIKFETDSDAPVTIRLYDFSMNLIRVLDENKQLGPGTYEAVWDGTDEQGRKVANGTIFYEIETGNGSKTGKILVLE